MAQFGINFGDPKGFTDWTKYAGFDANRPMMGIAPPPSGGMAPISPTLAQLAQKTSVNTQQVDPITVVPVAANKPMPVDKDGDGMISEWEE